MSDRWNESSLRKETTLLWRLGERMVLRAPWSSSIFLDLAPGTQRVDEESFIHAIHLPSMDESRFLLRKHLKNQLPKDVPPSLLCSLVIFSLFFFFLIHQSCYGGNEVYRFKKIAFSLTFALSLSLSLSHSFFHLHQSHGRIFKKDSHDHRVSKE